MLSIYPHVKREITGVHGNVDRGVVDEVFGVGIVIGTGGGGGKFM